MKKYSLVFVSAVLLIAAAALLWKLSYMTRVELAFKSYRALEKIGYRHVGSDMCVVSDKIKTITLVSHDRKIKETFKLPISYMSMPYERSGDLENSLHIDAALNSLEPRCKQDGKREGWDNSITVYVQVASSVNKYLDFQRKSYSDSEHYKDMEMKKYSDFKIRDSKSAKNPSARYVAVYPKESPKIPTDFFLECSRAYDLETFGVCKLRFTYRDTISAETTFHSAHLREIEQIYQKSINLVDRFYVRK